MEINWINNNKNPAKIIIKVKLCIIQQESIYNNTININTTK